MEERAATCPGGPQEGEVCASSHVPAPAGMTLGAPGAVLASVWGSAWLASSLSVPTGPGALGQQDVALNVGILAMQRPEILTPLLHQAQERGENSGASVDLAWGHQGTHKLLLCIRAKHSKKDTWVLAHLVFPGKSKL